MGGDHLVQHNRFSHKVPILLQHVKSIYTIPLCHRSHFGSRYTLGCCRHVSLFLRRFDSRCFHSSSTAGQAVRSYFWAFCRAPLLAAATVAAQSGPAFSTACPVLNATACWISWWPIVLALIMVSSAGASNAARTISSAQFNSDLLAP